MTAPKARPGVTKASMVAAAAWATAVVTGAVEVTRRGALTRPSPVLAFQGVTPLLWLANLAIVPGAAIRRRWALMGAAAIVAVAQAPTVIGSMRRERLPSWAETAPRLTVFMGNLQYDVHDPRKLDVVSAIEADIVVLVELTDTHAAGLRDRGLNERFPFQLDQRGYHQRLIGVYSPQPLAEIEPFGDLIHTTVKVGAANVDLVAVHPRAPSTRTKEREWRTLLEEVRRRASTATGPMLVTGDFNATRFHHPFARLLTLGLRDAHEARGKGLSTSWPTDGGSLMPVPVMRLDHALVNDGVAVIDVRDVELPGSDHHGLLVTIAVRP